MKSKLEQDRDYRAMKRSYDSLITANTNLMDKNKYLESENERLYNQIAIIRSMFDDPENHFKDGCFCKVIKKMLDEIGEYMIWR